jgi:LuxR family maltose regulon positive regulatory protein
MGCVMGTNSGRHASDAELLLASKCQIPAAPRHVLPRLRLVEQLDRATSYYKIVLVAAPAGYGKTTALAQWARTGKTPVAWLTIAPEDNDMIPFMRHLVLAWEMDQADVKTSELDILLGTAAPDREAVLAAFVRVATRRQTAQAFVLDDADLIVEPAVHTALTFLIDHAPPMLHFVVAARHEPPLPLSRYRARQELRDVTATDLRFTPAESEGFLNQQLQLGLPYTAVDRLQAEAEGWIAGLQLAGLTLQRQRADVDDIHVTGQHRFIADYLRDDVLLPLPGDLRRFLLQTSILERLCGSLCDAVTGQENGAEMLDELERRNLFLQPLDDHREWYRYHGLFRDFLRAELRRGSTPAATELHHHAAAWFLARDCPEEAFVHAHHSEDLALTRRIIVEHFVVKLLRGEVRVVQRWLDALPAAWIADDAGLQLAHAGILLATGQFDACARQLDTAERLAQKRSEHTILAKIIAMRCNIACFQNDLPRAESLAAEALHALPQTNLDLRPGVYGALGDTYRRNGHWRDAKACYLKLLDFAQTPSFQVQAVHVFGALADLALRQGHLREAADYWQRALTAIHDRRNWGHLPLPLIGWVYVRMGEILYEWNDLANAWTHLTEGLERAALGGDIRTLLAGYVTAGRVKLAQGDVDAALAQLGRARSHLGQAQFPGWNGRAAQLQVDLWLAQDRLQRALDWAEHMDSRDHSAASPEDPRLRLTKVKVLLATARASSLHRAQDELDRLIPQAEAEGRGGIVVVALGLRALVALRRRDHAGSLRVLAQALRLAAPEGYIRSFLDLGLPMAHLLQDARTRNVQPDYVAELLNAAEWPGTPATLASTTLPEPLTPREREVLALLAAGLTNREIAAQLTVATGTIKKHVGNIYAKLNVHSRTEAVVRATALNLLM